MRVLATVLGILALAGVALADKPPVSELYEPVDQSCNLVSVAYDWDFATGDHGFTTATCDPTGGLAVWEYGVSSQVPGYTDPVWGTILNDNYPNNSGQGLLTPSFTVGSSSNYLEVYHYVHTESNYDGCNVKVNGTVIQPMVAYPATINTSTSYYAYCVDMQPGWTGNGSTGPLGWLTSCFDLSAFMGQTIQVEFDLGSDSSVQYPGWFLAYVRVGGLEPTLTDSPTWGAIKGLFK
jgi:bacillopeptidase F